MKSRWDSLKPDHSDTKKEKGKKSNGNRVAKARTREPAASDDVRLEFSRLQTEYQQSRSETSAVRLAVFLQQESKRNAVSEGQLADWVSQDLVPRLEEIRDEDSTNEIRQLVLAVHYCMQNEAVASVILAPSIEEIELDGSGYQRTNPTFFRLVQILSLSIKSADTTCQKEAIACLTTLFDKTSSLEGKKKRESTGDIQIDASYVYSLFEKSYSMNDFDMASSIVRLIKVLPESVPEACSRIASTVLLPKIDSIETLRHSSSGIKNTPPLSLWLSALQRRNLTQADFVELLTECTVCLLENAPLSLWLRKSSHSTRSTINSFRDRIQDGLLSLIQICASRLERACCRPSDTKLAACILLRLPFEDNDTLIQEATRLVDTMVSFWRRQKGEKTTSTARALTSAMGGHITPQGNLTSMSIPLRAWLLANNGRATVSEILGTLSPLDRNDAAFIKNAVRTLPRVVLSGNSADWRSFVQFVGVWDATSQRIAAELMQSLLQGRNNFGGNIEVEGASDMVFDIAPRLQGWLASDDNQTKISALVCFGLLQERDWEGLIKSNALQLNLDSVLDICRSETAGQKVKSEACKSLGEMTTNLIPVIGPTPDVACHWAREICSIFVACLKEHKNTSCMAMFGLGNLAQALATRQSAYILEVDLQKVMARVILARMDSEEPKMASNSIRAASHAVCLLQHSMSPSGCEDFFNVTMDACLGHLSTRIQQALTLSKGGLCHFSWKQRSTVRKLGWGACNALVTIFSGVHSSFDFWTRQSFRTCAELLCLCLANLEIMNDKILVAAMTALRSIDAPNLSRVTEDETFSADAVTALVKTLNHENGKAKHQTDMMDATLIHLLDASSIADLRRVLEDTSTNDGLTCFYDWALAQNIPVDIWGKLALAAQRCSRLDVYWEQRFANRVQLLLQPEITDEL